MKMNKKINKKHIKALSYNPISNEYKCLGIKEINPDMAEYILDNLNDDNRPFSHAQLNNLENNIKNSGWKKDGGALTFNTDGNLTEYQHRLLTISRLGITVEAPVVIGVEPGCFTKAAGAKPRTVSDEIRRKDITAVKSEISTLNVLLKRRGEKRMTTENCVSFWNKWFPYIREGIKMTDELFDETNDLNSQAREVNAFATLMYFCGLTDVAKNLFSLLQSNLLEENDTLLIKQFIKFFKEESAFLTNTDKSRLLFKLLCVCADRLQKKPCGSIHLNITMPQLEHSKLQLGGTYRKFQINPDNLDLPLGV